MLQKKKTTYYKNFSADEKQKLLGYRRNITKCKEQKVKQKVAL